MSIIFPNRKCPLEKKTPLDVDGEPGRGYTTGIKFDIGLSKNRDSICHIYQYVHNMTLKPAWHYMATIKLTSVDWH